MAKKKEAKIEEVQALAEKEEVEAEPKKSAESWLTVTAVFSPGVLPEVMIVGTEEHPNITGKDMILLQKALMRERKLVRRDGSRRRREDDTMASRTVGPEDVPKRKMEKKE